MPPLEFEFIFNFKDYAHVYSTLLLQFNICSLTGYNGNSLKDNDNYVANLKRKNMAKTFLMIKVSRHNLALG